VRWPPPVRPVGAGDNVSDLQPRRLLRKQAFSYRQKTPHVARYPTLRRHPKLLLSIISQPETVGHPPPRANLTRLHDNATQLLTLPAPRYIPRSNSTDMQVNCRCRSTQHPPNRLLSAYAPEILLIRLQSPSGAPGGEGGLPRRPRPYPPSAVSICSGPRPITEHPTVIRYSHSEASTKSPSQVGRDDPHRRSESPSSIHPLIDSPRPCAASRLCV